MITVTSIYNDVARDSVYKDQNGYLDYNMFNRISRRAELRLLDWLTGDVTGQKLPISFSNQKSKDWLSELLKPYSTTLDAKGQFAKPEDYYYYDNMYSLTLSDNNCEDDNDVQNNVITLLDGDRFNQRKKTFIRGLKPTPEKAIAKEIGDSFEVYPANIPGVNLDYISIPVFAKIVSMNDTTFNQPVIDPANSTNFSWPESVREALIYFLTDSFMNHVTEQAGKEFNNASNASAIGK